MFKACCAAKHQISSPEISVQSELFEYSINSDICVEKVGIQQKQDQIPNQQSDCQTEFFSNDNLLVPLSSETEYLGESNKVNLISQLEVLERQQNQILKQNDDLIQSMNDENQAEVVEILQQNKQQGLEINTSIEQIQQQIEKVNSCISSQNQELVSQPQKENNSQLEINQSNQQQQEEIKEQKEQQIHKQILNKQDSQGEISISNEEISTQEIIFKQDIIDISQVQKYNIDEANSIFKDSYYNQDNKEYSHIKSNSVIRSVLDEEFNDEIQDSKNIESELIRSNTPTSLNKLDNQINSQLKQNEDVIIKFTEIQKSPQLKHFLEEDLQDKSQQNKPIQFNQVKQSHSAVCNDQELEKFGDISEIHSREELQDIKIKILASNQNLYIQYENMLQIVEKVDYNETDYSIKLNQKFVIKSENRLMFNLRRKMIQQFKTVVKSYTTFKKEQGIKFLTVDKKIIIQKNNQFYEVEE